MMRFPMPWRCAVAVAGLTVLAAVALATDSPPSGEAIYKHGLGRDARVVSAGMGEDGSVRLQGAAVACANCHGADARGGREGWIRPPDIRWQVLAAPQGRPRADGGVRPPYDAATFTRMLRTGVAPDGQLLDSVMPHYDLADDEIAALQRHLATVDDATAVGTQPPALVVLLPERTDGPAQRLLDAWRSCPAPDGARLPALTVMRYRSLPDALPALQSMALEGRLAALFAPFLVGAESQWHADGLADTPILLPITLTGLDADASSVSGNVRFALPSVRQQAAALLEHASGLPAASERRLMVLRDANTPAALLTSVRAQAMANGWSVSVQDVDKPIASSITHALALAPLPMPDDAANPDSLQWLVPTMQLQPTAAAAWTQRGHAVQVAYPWPPLAPGQSRWIGPEQASHAIGCELLHHLPPLPVSAQGTDTWQQRVMALPALQLHGWLTVPNAPTSDDAAIRVRPWPAPSP